MEATAAVGAGASAPADAAPSCSPTASKSAGDNAILPSPRSPSEPLADADPSGLGTLLPTHEASASAGALEAWEGVSAATNSALHADVAAGTEPPPALDEAALQAALQAPQLATFLHAAAPLCEEALQQNELADPLRDELAALADDEGSEGGAPSSSSSSRGHRAAKAGLVEHHSFSDLRSKGCTLMAPQFHPSRPGVVVVAAGPLAGAAAASSSASGLGQPLGQEERGCILVWSRTDPIHPQAVLAAPAPVTTLAWHPAQPHCLAAGLATGQVALFTWSSSRRGRSLRAQPPALPRR